MTKVWYPCCPNTLAAMKLTVNTVNCNVLLTPADQKLKNILAKLIAKSDPFLLYSTVIFPSQPRIFAVKVLLTTASLTSEGHIILIQ